MNPRDQPLDPVIDGVPHVIRRGMPYGPVLQGTEDDGADRGLFGIFLCADIRRQIYTLTGWIKRNDFSPVYAVVSRRTQDALLGNRFEPGCRADFALRVKGRAAELRNLPEFVHTKGTVFLLYPGKRTMELLSSGVPD